MENFIIVIFCFMAGIFAQRFKMVPSVDASKSINIWLIYISLPAIVLRFVPNILWTRDMLVPLITPLIIWTLSWILVNFYAKLRKIDLGTKVALTIGCGLGNTAFFGYPIVSAYFGVEALKIAVIVDVLTTVVFCTLGVSTILKAHALQSAESMNSKEIYLKVGKRLFSFPAFITCIFALIVPNFIDISFVNPFLDKIVATVAPMALFAIGLQLKLTEVRKSFYDLIFALSYKMCIAPAVILCLGLLYGSSSEVIAISTMQAATPAQTIGCVMAAQYGFNPGLCSMLVGLGIVVGLIATLFWYLVLPFFVIA